MRIVQVVQNLEIGGLERLAVDLAREQKRAGHAPSIYCVCQPGALAREAEAAGIPVVAFGKEPGFSPRTVWRMARCLRRERPDVVHTHNPVIHHYGVAAARLAGAPVVLNTLHGVGALLRDPRTARIFRATLPWTDAAVVVSESTRELCVRRLGMARDKTRVILNGIPTEKFAVERAQPGSQRPRIRFGTVGRLVPAKDHLTLVGAFARMLADIPQAELHILGDGPLRAPIEGRVTQLGMQSRVRLHGASQDVAGFLSKLDLFVLSSVTEGLPVAILEAMAAGLPIVSTRVGGVPEVAPEGSVAWFCPPREADALAAAMREAATSPALAAMGRAAFELARAGFGIREMWSQYQTLFHDLCLRNHARRLRLVVPAPLR